MGLTLVAMNVGHSYLSSIKLSIRPLRICTLALGVMLLFRLVSLVVLISFSPLKMIDQFELQNLTLLSIGLIRTLFGLVGPLILIYLVWETVKIQSTQSATGILYALLTMVLVGETSALYLTLTTPWPA